MARPKKAENEKAQKVTITLPPDLLERLDKIADVAGKPRSKMIQDLTLAALELVEALETFRLLSFGAMIRDNVPFFRKKFKQALEQAEQEQMEATDE